ncbi:MAG TPA: ABC transporter permease [Bryobacteraceae bacterium]|nr:ABC transporter permease [Bryobacteraceae bacterium]
MRSARTRKLQAHVCADEYLQEDPMRQFTRGWSGVGRSRLVLFLSLAICSAFFAGIYSISDVLLFRPLAASEPDRILYMLGLAQPSDFDAVQWWSQSRTVSPLSAYRAGNAAMLDGRDVTPVRLTLTAGDFFSTFGIRSAGGRFFSADEMSSSTPYAAVISSGLWRNQFAGQPVLGRRLVVGGVPVTVIGIAPAGFSFPVGTQIWLASRSLNGKSMPTLNASNEGPLVHREGWVGRLTTGMSVQQARAELGSLLVRLREMYTSRTGISVGSSVSVRLLREAMGRNVRTATWAMLVGAIALLLISTVNASILFLYESLQRTREFATRMTLGATIWTLLRQRSFEIARTVLAGGVCGYVLWLASAGAFRSFLSAAIPAAESRYMAGIHVLAACLLTAVASTAIAILPTMVQLGKEDLFGALKEYQHQTAGIRRHRMQRLLVTVQIALAITLAASAMLGFRSFLNMTTATDRLEAGDVLMSRVEMRDRTESVAATAVRYEGVVSSIAAIPGVKSVAGAASISGTGNLWVAAGTTRAAAQHVLVSKDFFRTMNIPLLNGQTFSSGGTAGGSAIVDIGLARDLWREQSPVGRELMIDGEDRARRVIGVVASGGYLEREASAPRIYLPVSEPYRGIPAQQMEIAVRAVGGIRPVASRMYQVLANDKRLLLGGKGIETLQERFDGIVLPDRVRAIVLTSLAAIGILLAVVGVYGVVSRRAHSRTHEMAVRMVHGATSSQVARLILMDAMEMVVVGVIFGVALSNVAARFMQSMLFGVADLNGPAIAAGALLLVTVGAAASAAPAISASRMNIRKALSEQSNR